MKPEFRYTIKKTNEIAAIKYLNEVIFPGEYLETGHNTYHWIVRDENGNFAGFCSCSYLGYGLMFLSRAGVLKNHRGHGLQKRFIRVRESFAKRSTKTKQIITYANLDNFISISNLIKADYKIYTPEYLYAGKDFMYFIKNVEQF